MTKTCKVYMYVYMLENIGYFGFVCENFSINCKSYKWKLFTQNLLLPFES